MTDTINLQELYDARKLKPGDEFLTRDGSSVWFIGVAKNTKQTYPFIFDRDLDVCLSYGGWQPDGTYIKGETNSWDIIRRAPRKITVWANVYDDNSIGSLFTSKKMADACKTSVSRRIGVLSGEIEVNDET